jgi:serine/threonine protein kinase
MNTQPARWKTWSSGWEMREEKLGGGGGGDVFLVRRLKTPTAYVERARVQFFEELEQFARPHGQLNQLDHDRLLKGLFQLLETHAGYEYGAAKILRLPKDTKKRQTALERMQRELDMMRTFGDHPHCLGLIEQGPDEGAFITEFQSKGSLEGRENLQEYKGNLLKALTDLRGIVDLLGQVHERKRVHRDIAPKNIFVAHDGRLILGDWGIVWNEDEDGTPLSETGDVIGTKDMMAPWSREHNIDAKPPSMDVYAFAKSLWMILAGTKLPLPREKWGKEEYDLEKRFPNSPEMYYVREIFKRTLVEDQKDCIQNGKELGELIDPILRRLRHAPEPLRGNRPRNCLVCGTGQYQFLTSGDSFRSSPSADRDLGMQRQLGLEPNLAEGHYKHIASCSTCGHVQVFMWKRGDWPHIWQEPHDKPPS